MIRADAQYRLSHHFKNQALAGQRVNVIAHVVPDGYLITVAGETMVVAGDDLEELTPDQIVQYELAKRFKIDARMVSVFLRRVPDRQEVYLACLHYNPGIDLLSRPKIVADMAEVIRLDYIEIAGIALYAGQCETCAKVYAVITGEPQ